MTSHTSNKSFFSVYTIPGNISLDHAPTFQCRRTLCYMSKLHYKTSCCLSPMAWQTSYVTDIWQEKMPVGYMASNKEENHNVEFLEFWSKTMPSAAENCTILKMQLGACYWVLMEMELFITGHQVTLQPAMSIMYWACQSVRRLAGPNTSLS